MRLRQVAEGSSVWEPVLRQLVERKRQAVRMGWGLRGVMQEEWREGLDRKKGYERYNKALGVCIQAWTGVAGVTTHAARRTGACLHFREGWALQTIAGVGGWSLVDVTNLLKYLGVMLDVVSLQQGCRLVA